MTCPYLQNNKCLLERPLGENHCLDCVMAGTNRLTGLGDLIALTINTTPVRHLKWKNCDCTKRQNFLNRLWSFIPKVKPKPAPLRKQVRKPINKKPCGCGKAKSNGDIDMDRR